MTQLRIVDAEYQKCAYIQGDGSAISTAKRQGGRELSQKCVQRHSITCALYMNQTNKLTLPGASAPWSVRNDNAI